VVMAAAQFVAERPETVVVDWFGIEPLRGGPNPSLHNQFGLDRQQLA